MTDGVVDLPGRGRPYILITAGLVGCSSELPRGRLRERSFTNRWLRRGCGGVGAALDSGLLRFCGSGGDLTSSEGRRTMEGGEGLRKDALATLVGLGESTSGVDWLMSLGGLGEGRLSFGVSFMGGGSCLAGMVGFGLASGVLGLGGRGSTLVLGGRGSTFGLAGRGSILGLRGSASVLGFGGRAVSGFGFAGSALGWLRCFGFVGVFTSFSAATAAVLLTGDFAGVRFGDTSFCAVVFGGDSERRDLEAGTFGRATADNGTLFFFTVVTGASSAAFSNIDIKLLVGGMGAASTSTS